MLLQELAVFCEDCHTICKVKQGLKPNHKSKADYLTALRMTLRNRSVVQELLFHSDRGVQYPCDECREALKAYTLIRQRMSRKTNYGDNAVADGFFRSLKTEYVYGDWFESPRAAAVEIFQYIEIFYNRERLHSSLGYRTPKQMEKLNLNPITA